MLPDPPHNKGYYSDHPKKETFLTWNDVGKYQTKITKLNKYLEKQEFRKKKKNYKNDLDILMQIKNRRRSSISEINHQMNIKKAQDHAKEYEMIQKKHELDMHMKNLGNSMQNHMDKHKKMKSYMDQENLRFRNKMKKNNEIENYKNQRKSIEMQVWGEEIKNGFKDFCERKKQSLHLQKKNDREYYDRENKNLNKMMDDNKKFYDNIRSIGLTPEVKKTYENMLKERSEILKEDNFFLIDKPVLDRLQRELEEEKFELENKMRMK